MYRVLFLMIFSSVLFFFAGCADPDREDALFSRLPVNILYQKAHAELDAGNYNKAAHLYEILRATDPYSPYSEQSLIETAYAYYQQENVAMTVAACDAFFRLYPRHPYADYMLYLKGIARFNGNQSFLENVTHQNTAEHDPQGSEAAFAIFQQLLQEYPHTQYAQDARLRMQYLLTVLSEHELRVARYYLSKKAYVAAINRARFLIARYPQSPYLEQALGILLIGYDQLALVQQEAETRSVLEVNFPHSPYLHNTLAHKMTHPVS